MAFVAGFLEKIIIGYTRLSSYPVHLISMPFNQIRVYTEILGSVAALSRLPYVAL